MEKEVYFRSGSLELEGLFHLAPGQKGVVVCHPHPLYGGEMRNKVVEALVSALSAVGFSTLRFNFRGVGRSQGSYGNVAGEISDALAAVNYLQKESGAEKIALCGYSFGAAVAARAGATADQVSALVLVALPLSLPPAPELLKCSKPKLFIAGGRDQIAPAQEMEAFFSQAREPKELCLLDEADHFFVGQEEELSSRAARFLQAF